MSIDDKIDIVDALLLGDEIMDIVAEEVAKIKKGARSPEALMKLEKLSKIYTAVFACNRENIKSGLFGQLSGEFLEESKGKEPEEGDQDTDDNL